MYILKRLSEPSTWAGLSIIGTIFHMTALSALDPVTISSAIAALASIFLPENNAH